MLLLSFSERREDFFCRVLDRSLFRRSPRFFDERPFPLSVVLDRAALRADDEEERCRFLLLRVFLSSFRD